MKYYRDLTTLIPRKCVPNIPANQQQSVIKRNQQQVQFELNNSSSNGDAKRMLPKVYINYIKDFVSLDLTDRMNDSPTERTNQANVGDRSGIRFR